MHSDVQRTVKKRRKCREQRNRNKKKPRIVDKAENTETKSNRDTKNYNSPKLHVDDVQER